MRLIGELRTTLRK